jgi:hypothetical protein
MTHAASHVLLVGASNEVGKFLPDGANSSQNAVSLDLSAETGEIKTVLGSVRNPLSTCFFLMALNARLRTEYTLAAAVPSWS